MIQEKPSIQEREDELLAAFLSKGAAERKLWLAERRTGCGGSDAGTYAGINPNKTPRELWEEKTGLVEREDISNKPAPYFGTVLEDVVCREFTVRTERKVRRVNRILRHPDYPFMICNLDRIVDGEDAIVEAKTAGFWAGQQFGEASDAVPPVYKAQGNHNIFVASGALNRYIKVCYMPVLIGGQDFRIYEIKRDEDYIISLVRCARAFWKHVVDKTPPPPINAADAKAYWPQSDAVVLEGTQQASEWHDELMKLKATLKPLIARHEELEIALKAFMGKADTLTFGGKTLATWKSSKDSERFDQAAFKEAKPDVFKEFCKTVPGARVFLPKGGDK